MAVSLSGLTACLLPAWADPPDGASLVWTGTETTAQYSARQDVWIALDSDTDGNAPRGETRRRLIEHLATALVEDHKARIADRGETDSQASQAPLAGMTH